MPGASPFQPLVSIVIPVYNGSNFVAEAIDSALAQTYPNIEVIVVNDGSTDQGATTAIAQSYGEKIRYFEKPNGGVATALNLGIEEARGTYISWLSHDDLYLPEKVATQVAYLANLTEREVVLYSDFDLVDETGKKIGQTRLDHQMLARAPLYSVLRGAIHGCSTLVPRELFQRFGGFDPALATTQDYALWFQMARAVPFHHMPTVLIQSRWHDTQGSKIHPKTLQEANELWVFFCDTLDSKERAQCEPSDYLFFNNLAEFLASTPYQAAYNHVRQRASEAGERLRSTVADRKVSLILPLGEESDSSVKALQSALAQTHEKLEIVVVAKPGLDLTGRIFAEDSRIRVETCSSKSLAAQLNHGLSLADGDFVAFLESGASWRPDKLLKQLEQMVLRGARTSYSDYEVAGTRVRCGIAEPQFPSLVGSCPIARSTVLLCGSLNPRFEEDTPGEDICLWLDLALHHEWVHVSEPLVQLESAPPTLNAAEQLGILGHLCRSEQLMNAPLAACERVRQVLNQLETAGARDLVSRIAQGQRWPGAPVSNRVADKISALTNLIPMTTAARAIRKLEWSAQQEARLLTLLRKVQARLRAWKLSRAAQSH